MHSTTSRAIRRPPNAWRSGPGVRRLPLIRYPYVVYYEIGANEVTILRILHGARRQPL